MNLFVKIFGSYEGKASLDAASADVKKLDKDAEQAAKGGLSSLRSGLGDITKIAGGFVVGQAMTKLPGVIEDAAQRSKELELEAKKFNIVFGDSKGVVEDWAKQNAASFGLSKAEARNLAAGMADLLVPMGMTRDAAADMATKTIGLSGALAEWSGGQKSAAEVSEILQKAYLGETDGLKSLGVSISAADISTRLLEKGQDKLTGAAQKQAQALAIQELIFEKSTDAQTAFAEGADSTARKQAEATAKMHEAKDALAVGLAPALAAVSLLMADLVGFLATLVESAMPGLVAATGAVVAVFGFLAEHKDETIAVLAGVAGAIATVLVPAIVAWTAAEYAKITALIASAAAFIAANAPLIAIAVGIGLLIAGIILLVQNWDSITAKVPALGIAFDAVKLAIEAVVNWFKTDFLNDVTQTLDAFGKAFDIGKSVIEPQLRVIKDIVDIHLEIIKGLFKVFSALLTGDFAGAWSAFKDMISGIWGNIKSIVETGIQAVKDLGPKMLEAGTELGKQLFQGLKAAIGAVGGLAEDVGHLVVSAIKSFVNSEVIDKINSALVFTIPIPFHSDFHLDPPDIPHLARGGITTGPTLAVVGDNPGGREAIIPLNADGSLPGSGINFHIYALDGDSVRRVIPEIARQLKIHQRQSGFRFA